MPVEAQLFGGRHAILNFSSAASGPMKSDATRRIN
jgi:hypothetical protein